MEMLPRYHKDIFDNVPREHVKEVYLREFDQDEDLELIMAWRNIPSVYRGFYTQDGPLSWEGHYRFWTTRHNWKTWIIMVKSQTRDRGVGYVSVGQLDSWYPDVGILIGEPLLHRQGVGTKALTLLIRWLKDNGYTRARASILETNTASQRLFEKVGFTFADDAREGELLYDLKIKELYPREDSNG